jgi:hypothetical protein
MTRLDTNVLPKRPKMIKTRTKPSAEDVRSMLLEIAFVLHCTRKVKAEILAEREERESRKLPTNATAV